MMQHSFKKNSFYLILMLCTLLAEPLWAQIEYTLPENYKVVLTKIEGNDAFEKRWNRLMIDKLGIIKEHILSKGERIGVEKTIKLASLQKLGEELSQVQLEMSRLELKGASTQKGRHYELFLRQEELKGDIKKLEKKPVKDLPEFLPILYEIVEETYDENLAYFQPENYVWLYGKVAVLQPGVVYFEYFAFNSLTNKRVAIVQQTFNESEVVRVAEVATQKLRGLLLGRRWGSLSLTSPIVSSEYYLDGEEVSDPRLLDILEPGKYELVVKTPGFKTETRNIEIQPLRVLRLNFKPVVLPESRRFIQTNPAGANVFLDGEYKGKTPLNIIAGPNQILYLSYQGYQPLFFTMNEEPKLTFTLLADGFDAQKEIKDAQTWFYASLGLFVASLIVPITMYSMQRNLADKASLLEFHGDIGGAQSARNQAGVYGIAFWSSSGVSAGLMGWAIYQLVHYVRTSAK